MSQFAEDVEHSGVGDRDEQPPIRGHKESGGVAPLQLDSLHRSLTPKLLLLRRWRSDGRDREAKTAAAAVFIAILGGTQVPPDDPLSHWDQLEEGRILAPDSKNSTD